MLKGAADGGLHIPHSTKKFPGYKPGSGEVPPRRDGAQLGEDAQLQLAKPKDKI